jgi:hypothetical protein
MDNIIAKNKTQQNRPYIVQPLKTIKVLHNHAHVIIGLLQKVRKCFPMQITCQGGMWNPHYKQFICTSTLITNTIPPLKHFYKNKTHMKQGKKTTK